MRAVTDHEPKTHDVDEGTESDEVLVAAGVFDYEGDEDRYYCGGKGKCLSDVSGCGDRFMLDDEQVGVEVGLDGEVVRHLRELVN